MPQVALALTGLRRRDHFTDDDELVFVNEVGACSATTHWCAAAGPHRPKAGVRRLRFHDLRHSFGTMAVRQFPITGVQTWMGHADIATTREYIRYAPQPEAAALLGVLVSEQLGPWADVRGAGEQHAGFSFVAAGKPVASEP